ncbi:MAG: hypothetical protein LBV09_02735 [Deferribacteraceae bacterium]|jgi:hypothetical protein|nr:hypothetical protein [Deferribacteraceae bacterium]
MKKLLALLIAFFALGCEEGSSISESEGVNYMVWLQIESILQPSNAFDFYYFNDIDSSLMESWLATEFVAYHNSSRLTDNGYACVDVEVEAIIDTRFAPLYPNDYITPNAYQITMISGCRASYPIDPQWEGRVIAGVNIYNAFAEQINELLFNTLSNNPLFRGAGYVYFDELGEIN